VPPDKLHTVETDLAAEHAREDLHLMRSDEIFFQQPGPLVP